jgi:hypothetical protein
MSLHATATDLSVTSVLPPYAKFKMTLKSKGLERQYPNLLEKFSDFCKFEGPDIEQKAIMFYLFAKSKSQEEIEDLVIKFILFQMDFFVLLFFMILFYEYIDSSMSAR